MTQIPWTAPAISHVHDQPPTLAGLLNALAAADTAALLLATSGQGHAPGQAGAVSEECRIARALLEAATLLPVPAPPAFDAPADPGDPVQVRHLDPVLAACLDLALDLLDNEDEPLGVSHVTAVGRAIDHLTTARWQCWEAARRSEAEL